MIPEELSHAIDPMVIPTNADFDNDLDVDGADFLLWQAGLGLGAGAATSDGDANGDLSVDAKDLEIWDIAFGQTEDAATRAASSHSKRLTPLLSPEADPTLSNQPRKMDELQRRSDYRAPDAVLVDLAIRDVLSRDFATARRRAAKREQESQKRRMRDRKPRRGSKVAKKNGEGS